MSYNYPATWEHAMDVMNRLNVGHNVWQCAGVGARHYMFDVIRERKAKRALEIGTYLGVSALALAMAVGEGGQVITIDKEDVLAKDGLWSTEVMPSGTKVVNQDPEILMKLAGVGNRVRFINAYAPDCFANVISAPIDFAFVDGWKHEEIVYSTLIEIIKLMPNGGHILIHDVFPNGEEWIPGHCKDDGPWKAYIRVIKENPSFLCRLIQQLPEGEERMAEIIVPQSCDR